MNIYKFVFLSLFFTFSFMDVIKVVILILFWMKFWYYKLRLLMKDEKYMLSTLKQIFSIYFKCLFFNNFYFFYYTYLSWKFLIDPSVSTSIMLLSNIIIFHLFKHKFIVFRFFKNILWYCVSLCLLMFNCLSD